MHRLTYRYTYAHTMNRSHNSCNRQKRHSPSPGGSEPLWQTRSRTISSQDSPGLKITGKGGQAQTQPSRLQVFRACDEAKQTTNTSESKRELG